MGIIGESSLYPHITQYLKRKKIYINNKLSLEKVKQVLCHEITHAAMFSYDIQLTYDQEELLADLLATYGQEIIDITNKIFSKIKNNRG